MSNFIDQVIFKQDDRYVIAVTKDHNKGLVVQVARMNPKHVRTDNGASYEGHTPIVMWDAVISLGEQNKTTREIQFKDPSMVENELKVALSKAQQYVQKCIHSENNIDSLLLKLDKEAKK